MKTQIGGVKSDKLVLSSVEDLHLGGVIVGFTSVVNVRELVDCSIYDCHGSVIEGIDLRS